MLSYCSKILLLLSAVFLSAIDLFADEYAHPGGMHSKAQIDYVKEQIKLKKEPYYTAGKQLLVKADQALSSGHHALADFDIPGYYIKPKEHRENSQSIQ